MSTRSLVAFLGSVVRLCYGTGCRNIPCPGSVYSCVSRMGGSLTCRTKDGTRRQSERFFERLVRTSRPICGNIGKASGLSTTERVFGGPGLHSTFGTASSIDSTLSVFRLRTRPAGHLVSFYRGCQMSLTYLLLVKLHACFRGVGKRRSMSVGGTVTEETALGRGGSNKAEVRSFPFHAMFSRSIGFVSTMCRVHSGRGRLFHRTGCSPARCFTCHSEACPRPRGKLACRPVSLACRPVALRRGKLRSLKKVRCGAG